MRDFYVWEWFLALGLGLMRSSRTLSIDVWIFAQQVCSARPSSSPTLYDNDDGIIFISSTTFFYCFQERIKLIILENYFEGEGLYKRNEHSNDRALELIMDCNSLFPVADMIGMVQLLRNDSICVQYWSDCVHLPSFSLIFLPRNWI